MKITDSVIQKFWGQGKGFVVASLTRWGGFVQDEDTLDDAYFTSLTKAISARDRGKVFEDELHMINYMMRLCYWAWCEASERRMQRSIVVSESSLYPEGAEDDFRPKVIELSEDQPDLHNKSQYLIDYAEKLINDKFGYYAVQLYRRCIIDGQKIKEVAEDLELTVSKAGALIRVTNNLLKKRLESHAKQYGLV